MITKRILTAILFCISQFINAQSLSISVKNKQQEPLPSAIISFVNNNNQKNGILTNQDGNCKLNINNILDSIEISFIGYKSIKEHKKDIKEGMVFYLIPITYNLEPVVIHRGKFIENGSLGVTRRKRTSSFLFNINDIYTAVKFENPDTSSSIIISGITIGVDVKKKCPQGIQVRLIESSNNGIPGNDLTDSKLIYNSNDIKNELLEIDISKENIQFHSNGVFVAVQLIQLSVCKLVETTSIKLQNESADQTRWGYIPRRKLWYKDSVEQPPHIGILFKKYKK